MSLKQSVVIRSEYSLPTPSGGTRGSTPGSYVLRYVARADAMEAVAPIKKQRIDDYITRYTAREDAVMSLDLSSGGKRGRRVEKTMLRKGQGKGGVAFGYGQASLSHEELFEGSRDIQEHFDNGHTVMKTILAFDEDYLREHGIVDEDFAGFGRGRYAGEVDQMKLRLAIMRGLDRMGQSNYDDLRYIGLIQVDTAQLHCHLTMVDAGEGTVMPDGTQRGKIDESSKSLLRRGLDSFLDEKQRVKHLSSAVGYEQRNVNTYMKRWAHQQMTNESLPQFLLATLPEDRRLWRAGTNREEMAKPNRVARELAEDVLSRPDSPMSQAMDRVHDYANHRTQREGLSGEQRMQLVDTGREQIIDRGVNAIYTSLRQMPEDYLQVRTPMLDVMSMDYEELAEQAGQRSGGDDADLVGFSFRLRTYSSRKKHHEAEREHYHDMARQWEALNRSGEADPDSAALHRFYLNEREHHSKLSSKYRHFLPFGTVAQDWRDRWEEAQQYSQALLSVESMRNDASLKRMKDPDEAEQIASEVYGQRGGHLVCLNDEASRARLDQRVQRLRQRYEDTVEDLRMDLSSAGMRLDITVDDQGMPQPEVTEGAEHSFEAVKGLDLHQLGFDFASDVPVGEQARSTFVQAAAQRQELLDDAVEYLRGSQRPEDVEQAVDQLPVTEVGRMSRMAARIDAAPEGEAVLPSSVAFLQRERAQRRMARSAASGLSDQVSSRITAGMEAGLRDVPDLSDSSAEPQQQGPE